MAGVLHREKFPHGVRSRRWEGRADGTAPITRLLGCCLGLEPQVKARLVPFRSPFGFDILPPPVVCHERFARMRSLFYAGASVQKLAVPNENITFPAQEFLRLGPGSFE